MANTYRRWKITLQFRYFSIVNKVCCIMIVLCFVHAENPCNEAQFWVEDEEGKSLCIECNECPPGHGLSRNCGQRISPEAMVICERCKAGFSFSSNYDVSSCLPCNPPCVKDQIVLQNCTTKTNVKCKSECYSKNRYYDNKLGCLPCSKCCGDGKDEVEDECKQKLGPASDMICSFNSSVNRCAPTTTTTKMKSTQSNFTLNTTAPHNSVSSTDQNSTSLQFEEKHSHHGIAVIVSILCVELFGIILVTAAFQYRCFSSRRWSCLRPTGTDAAEIGRELYTKAVTDAPLVLCNKESKPLGSLLEHDSILQRICEVLDSRPPGCGNYRAVAQHYGFDHYQIESVLEQFGGGPSRALIESLAATQPELKIEEFAEVTEKKTKRKDVVKLLIEYDSAEVESL